MSALTPVGISQSVSSSTGSAAVTLPISQKTDTIRVVAESAGVHVAIGVTPVATNSNFYVSTTGASEIAIGKPASQRVVGITINLTPLKIVLAINPHKSPRAPPPITTILVFLSIP